MSSYRLHPVFAEAEGAEKRSGRWLYVTHGRAEAAAAMAAARAGAEAGYRVVMFKMEPLVLHISCRDLQAGRRLLGLALDAGFKNSGMIAARRIMVAVRGTLRLDAPLVLEGRLAVPEAYVDSITALGNAKMEMNEVSRVWGLGVGGGWG